MAAETIIQCELGSGSHDLYYKRLKKIILPDTKLTYQLSRKYFCEDIRQGFTLLNKNYVWRPLVQGSIDGLNYRQTLNHLPSYFLKSFLNARCIRG